MKSLPHSRVASIVAYGIAFALLTAAAAVTVSAQVPMSSLIVLNKEDATLVVVDPASRRIVGKVPTGEGPHEVAVSSDGKLAFVGNYGSGQTPGSTISVIDLVALKEIRKVD